MDVDRKYKKKFIIQYDKTAVNEDNIIDMSYSEKYIMGPIRNNFQTNDVKFKDLTFGQSSLFKNCFFV